MLVGGDLGVLCLVLVVVVVLVFQIIGVVLRRKWWFAAARRVEIKRLLILASEESARAELEATTGYGVGSAASVSHQLQYQCAVCFCPTTTRCAQCKAVRYCSGKCQIIHWRQGHKEDCRPFTIFDQSNDRGDGDTHCASSSSSGWSVDSSNDSLSEPSTPSSGIWDGPIESSSSESGGDIVAPMTQRGSNTKTIVSDDGPTIQGIKKPINEAALSEELCKDDLKSNNFPILRLQKSKSIHVDTCSNSHVLKSRENKSSTSSAYCVRPSVRCGGHSITKDAKVVSSSPSLSSERSNYVATDTSSSSYALRFREVGSLLYKDSDASLTSCSGRDSGQTALSKVGYGIHGVTTSSSQFPSYSENARNGLKTSTLKVVDQLKASKLSILHYQSAAGSETVGRCTAKGLFPYELFVKMYNWDTVELHPCGLINCGNSCYANAVLQCLTFTPPLTAYLLQGLHSKACAKKQWCFTCEFESIILKAKEGNSPLSPIRILSHIEKISRHLGHGREADAHEFLRYAIDTMQSICLKEAGTKTSGSLDEKTTLIGLTFGGYLQSKIKCMKCGGKSERHERMMDLTVEIDGNICTLEEALRQFTGSEILDGENKYQCSRCKSFEKAKKKLTIMEAPNILTIALKRFQSGKFGKLNKSIQFPESLDIAPYMSVASDKSSIYRLYGVVVHLDIMNDSFSGHYVCYVKNIQDKWFKIDDSTVNAVELERVLTKGAYMLFYARCSPRPPKLMNSLVPRDPRKPKNPSLRSISYSTGPSGTNQTDCLNYQTTRKVFYPDHSSFQRTSPISEEDSSSDNSSSFFSEVGSCSTESSTRDSTSTDDYFDQIFGDLGHNLNSPWRNSLDSDTSFFPSLSPPLYSKHSPLANLESYTSKYLETSSFLVDHAESARDGAWARQPRSSKVESLEGKGSVSFLCSDMTKQCRKLGSGSNFHRSSSCRETNSDRLGWLNPFNSVKSGIYLRKSRGTKDLTSVIKGFKLKREEE